jgi:hypothetical protein
MMKWQTAIPPGSLLRVPAIHVEGGLEKSKLQSNAPVFLVEMAQRVPQSRG